MVAVLVELFLNEVVPEQPILEMALARASYVDVL